MIFKSVGNRQTTEQPLATRQNSYPYFPAMRLKPTLVILAAGMGSRYGGLKQIDPVGPNGATVLDYSVYDAVRAGFGKVVFVIRKDFAEVFHEKIGKPLEDKIRAEYAFQDFDDLPEGFTPPPNRTKPWGTGHAIWAARKVVNEPFCVINADDFYGQSAFRTIRKFFENSNGHKSTPLSCSLVAYRLANTLSEHGGVSRGLLEVDEKGFLLGIEEASDIRSNTGTPIISKEGETTRLDPETLVSMNFWGFHPTIFKHFEKRLIRFLEERGDEEKSEFYVADPVESAVREKAATFEVLPNGDHWFGVTYRKDKKRVTAAISDLIAKEEYPEKLWD